MHFGLLLASGTDFSERVAFGLVWQSAEGGEGVDPVPDGLSAAIEKRRLRRAASRLRGCYLAFFLAGLAALLALASFGAE